MSLNLNCNFYLHIQFVIFILKLSLYKTSSENGLDFNSCIIGNKSLVIISKVLTHSSILTLDISRLLDK